MTTFYNTTQESGAELRQSKAKAGAQDELILDYFRQWPDKRFSPEEIHEALFTSRTPLTSIRRAINTLEKGLFIRKSGHMVNGIFGKLVNTYELSTGNNNQLKLI